MILYLLLSPLDIKNGYLSVSNYYGIKKSVCLHPSVGNIMGSERHMCLQIEVERIQ